MTHYIVGAAIMTAIIFVTVVGVLLLVMTDADLSTPDVADPGDTGEPVDETNWQGE